MIALLIWSALTKCWFAFVVGHCVQQGDGATGIACCLLQEINLRVRCNLVCLLLSERLVLPDTKTDRHKHRQSMVMVICPWEHSAFSCANYKRAHGATTIQRTRFVSLIFNDLWILFHSSVYPVTFFILWILVPKTNFLWLWLHIYEHAYMQPYP